jgi:electron transport complex protein RnfG
MVGYNPEGIIQKTATLSHKESPGIGSKITEEPFVQQFVQFDPESQSPLLVKDGGDIDAISGATVSSRAYSQDIQNSYSAYLSAKEYMSNPPAENKATDPNSDTQEGSADV